MKVTHHRHRDGLLSIMEDDEAGGMPPMHLLEGGAGGYPDAKVFVWRRCSSCARQRVQVAAGRDP